MNDVIWYSRFAVLVGALVLLVQAVAGRAAGLITFLAIVLLCGGLVVFLVALGVEGMAKPVAETGNTGPEQAPLGESPPEAPAENHREPVPESAVSEADAGE